MLNAPHRAAAALLVLTVIIPAMPISAQQGRGERSLPEKLAELDRTVEAEMAATKTPGAAVLLVQDDKVIYSKGFGTTSVEGGAPVTPDTLFRIGSTTKMFTAAAFATLADQNKVRFDAPVSTYLPGLPSKVGRLNAHQLLSDLMNKGIAERRFGEMIVVMPDQNTKAFGSFYVNSSATGDWADFTAKELVSYIDGKYRTLPTKDSRGIVGHSMGGYGAITLGMKHPEVYSVVYGMNPAIMGWAADFTPQTPAFERILSVNSFDELMKSRDLYTMATVTLAQAFSPNPSKPPFFADFPFEMADGKLRPTAAFAKWESHFPINMVPRYVDNLKRLRGIRFDSGSEDEFKFIVANSRALSAELTKYGIEHIFEEYNGDHRNRLWSRTGRLYNQVFPYFWLLLQKQSKAAVAGCLKQDRKAQEKNLTDQYRLGYCGADNVSRTGESV